jgi:hypothetical protein
VVAQPESLDRERLHTNRIPAGRLCARLFLEQALKQGPIDIPAGRRSRVSTKSSERRAAEGRRSRSRAASLSPLSPAARSPAIAAPSTNRKTGVCPLRRLHAPEPTYGTGVRRTGMTSTIGPFGLPRAHRRPRSEPTYSISGVLPTGSPAKGPVRLPKPSTTDKRCPVDPW